MLFAGADQDGLIATETCTVRTTSATRPPVGFLTLPVAFSVQTPVFGSSEPHDVDVPPSYVTVWAGRRYWSNASFVGRESTAIESFRPASARESATWSAFDRFAVP